MKNGRLACVIFDIDGTLTRTNELIFASFNHVAQKYLGRTFPPQEIIKLFGPPEEGALRAMFRQDLVPDALEDLLKYYREHHSSLAAVHPGMGEILQFLKARGVLLAIFTGKGRDTTEITLRALDLVRYFDLIVSGDDVVRHKPDPEGIQKVLRTFTLEPAEVLMVGDSLGDITAARSAGVHVASVLWDSYEREKVLRADTDYVFHDSGEMLTWFRAHVN